MRHTVDIARGQGLSIFWICELAFDLAVEDMTLDLSRLWAGPALHQTDETADRVGRTHMAQLQHGVNRRRRDHDQRGECRQRGNLIPTHIITKGRRGGRPYAVRSAGVPAR